MRGLMRSQAVHGHSREDGKPQLAVARGALSPITASALIVADSMLQAGLGPELPLCKWVT